MDSSRAALVSCALVFTLASAGCGGDDHGANAPARCGDWPEWGQSPAHQGQSCVAGQAPVQTLDDVVFDPFALQEAADSFGLVVHYQAPLIIGDDLYLEVKSGTYVPCIPPQSGLPEGCGSDSWGNEVWNEVHYKIGADGKLTRLWTFPSDWKPEPPIGFEPVFHGAISGGFLYVPGFGGSVWKLDRQDGHVVAHLTLLPSPAPIDPTMYVAGPIVTDAQGDIFYNLLMLDAGNDWGGDASGALVRIAPDKTVTAVDYRTLVPDAPQPGDGCEQQYDTNMYPLPLPPPPNADGTLPDPVITACGTQRPALNVAPAIGPDGTIYTVSRAHYAPAYSYVVAVHNDLLLSPKWDASLRGRLNDGCGVLTPDDGDDKNGDCRPGAPMGVDPYTGKPPAVWADDSSSSSPVVLPDGNILYGGLTYYNGDRGHLMQFDPNGKFLTSFDFGWDVTPAVRVHDGSYSIITKDNHYGIGYADTGSYFITSLNPFLKPEWKFLSTNTRSCSRDASGNVSCVDDHPNGFEWCINAPAVDKDGNVYGNSEDGNLYVIDKDGNQKASYFLDQALAAAYTPIALDEKGRIFALNSGHLLVVGAAPAPAK